MFDRYVLFPYSIPYISTFNKMTIRRLLTLTSRLDTLGKARFYGSYPKRCLHDTALRRTDGVFRGLADNRLPRPWIEAWRLQQEKKNVASDEARSQERDLSPKKMSDSYHRVVLPLGRDPWLSDTYINASGHIRSSARPSARLDFPPSLTA